MFFSFGFPNMSLEADVQQHSRAAVDFAERVLQAVVTSLYPVSDCT